MRKNLLRIVAALVAILPLPSVFAQGNPAYMQFGQAKALYYKPDTGPAPKSPS